MRLPLGPGVSSAWPWIGSGPDRGSPPPLAAVLAGLIIQIGVSSGNTSVFGGTPLGRSLNIFAFFTIQSNVIVGVNDARCSRSTRGARRRRSASSG